MSPPAARVCRRATPRRTAAAWAPLVVATVALWPCATLHAAEPVASLRELLALDAPVATVAPAEALDPQRDPGDGVSLGTTSSGHLASAVALPRDGEHIALAQSHRDRHNHYVAQELADILIDVAATMQGAANEGTRLPRLLMGDASSEHGGDLRGHASHNNGRDIDLVFYVRDAEGRPAEPPRFVKFRDGLTSKDGDWTFDLERNWAFVEGLLTHDGVQTQYIFIYDPLKQALLQHAVANEVDADLIARAASVLHQPSDSAPHDDHYHVRVYCSSRDRLEGCDNRGPRWPWADLHDDDVGLRAATLVRAVEADAGLGAAALEHLVAMGARGASVWLAERLAAATTADDRQALREALWATGVETSALPALAATLARETDAEARRSLLGLVAATGHPDAIAVLAEVAERSDDVREVARAVEVLSRIEHRLAVPALIELLDHEDDQVRTAVVGALQSLTNQAGPAGQDVAELERGWQGWWHNQRTESRAEWMRAGFVDAGIELASIADIDAVEALIEAQTTQPAFVADNAHRVLMRRLGYWFSPATPPEVRRQRWSAWWSRNAWRFRDTSR